MSDIQPNTANFFEDILESLLSEEKINYCRQFVYATDAMNVGKHPAVVETIKDVCQMIFRGYRDHIYNLVTILMRSNKSAEYINAFGSRFFDEKMFTWRSFRLFTGLICQLLVACYKTGLTSLFKRLLTALSEYFYKNMQDRIKDLFGWDACVQDCIIVAKIHEGIKSKPKVPIPPCPFATTPTTVRTESGKRMKRCRETEFAIKINNDRGGNVTVIENDNALTELCFSTHSSTKDSQKVQEGAGATASASGSNFEAQKELNTKLPCFFVDDLIKISKEALKNIGY